MDTQTILTIQNHVITKNHRVSVLHSEHKTWQLKIKDIRESDRGFYMCQINTDPMKSQTGYLDVVGELFLLFVRCVFLDFNLGSIKQVSFKLNKIGMSCFLNTFGIANVKTQSSI